ncbi:MAG: hypothetical protein OXK79_13815 [Chloroflexota bacterium]|nr:hypothetical protein [Chloroflexota bacterium]
MTKIPRLNLLTLFALPVVLAAFTACGGGGATPTAESPTEAPDASRASLDEYLLAVCDGQAEWTAWEEGVSLRELSSGLGQFMEIMESLEPPSQVSDWHDATLAFGKTFKNTVDDYLEDSKGQTEDEFLLSMFFTLPPHFQPVEQAIAGMDPDVRSRMVEADCIDEETIEVDASTNTDASGIGSPSASEDFDEIAIGSSVDGTLDEPEEVDIYSFRAQADETYLIIATWESLSSIQLVISDRRTFDRYKNSRSQPFRVSQTFEETGTYYVSVSARGTGSYTLYILVEMPVGAPSNVRYVPEGPAIRITWDPVEGADFYNVYHDRFRDDGCQLAGDGRPAFCEEVATNLTETTYLHTYPDIQANYYWVTACNIQGCSEVDTTRPAPKVAPAEAPTSSHPLAPSPPTNQRYTVLGAGWQVRITWDAVDGADFYKVYHNNQRACSVSISGPSSCEELGAGRVHGLEDIHLPDTPFDPLKDYYWVVACNSNGCSQIDSENPATPAEN